MPEPVPTSPSDDLGWSLKLGLAEAVVPLVGRLHRDHGVTVTVHGRSLVGESVVGLIKAHRFARHVDDVELPLEVSLDLLQVLVRLPLSPAIVDIARLSTRLSADGTTGEAAVRDLLAPLAYDPAGPDRPAGPARASRDVVLYGFGRIGRLLARVLVEQGQDPWGLRLRAVVVRRGGANDLVKRASLLRRDSVHGAFAGTITVDEENERIHANGTTIQVIYSDDPATVDYARYGIEDALVIDNTGKWRDADGLAQHLRSPGAGRVLLTAPGKGSVKNVVHGLNQDTLTADDRIASAASCTTNAIAPVLKAVHEEFGIVRGHVETVHSFTNDQNLIDNYHKGDRRGRSAVLNMVLTETGAAKAVAKALPELEGKLTGNSIRVPTPDVSLAVLHLTLERATDKAALNEYLRQVSLDSPLQDQVDYTDSPEVVSTDFIGTRKTGVVDALATIVTGDAAILYVWYDNERGYCEQVLRVAQTFQGLDRPVFPAVHTRAGAGVGAGVG
ncbi:glyceraldehyde-3-phosphate dehydrogenase [Kineococcus rhizosphaerae]|uniref:Glyceraldehyde 3-phosphate dehydrogenase n=1 Tax=Kineococcus rhizosphaerae TaxID=559628 RepID=A0A2T0R3K8_9ACTN|nr:glyceraldehyde-3-phosphate dehydrogenase [Kineococcus rhizosphaerae]PRY14647.1 glyceraldehyde 3-phosphate dehydrogenase [Kineococcus rhizosphaerae]